MLGAFFSAGFSVIASCMLLVEAGTLSLAYPSTSLLDGDAVGIALGSTLKRF